jgi:hypothetical protein
MVALACSAIAAQRRRDHFLATTVPASPGLSA